MSSLRGLCRPKRVILLYWYCARPWQPVFRAMFVARVRMSTDICLFLKVVVDGGQALKLNRVLQDLLLERNRNEVGVRHESRRDRISDILKKHILFATKLLPMNYSLLESTFAPLLVLYTHIWFGRRVPLRCHRSSKRISSGDGRLTSHNEGPKGLFYDCNFRPPIRVIRVLHPFVVIAYLPKPNAGEFRHRPT